VIDWNILFMGKTLASKKERLNFYERTANFAHNKSLSLREIKTGGDMT